MKTVSEYALFETDKGDMVLVLFDAELFQQSDRPAKIVSTMPLTIELINRTIVVESFNDQQLGPLLQAAELNKADIMRVDPHDNVVYEALPLLI